MFSFRRMVKKRVVLGILVACVVWLEGKVDSSAADDATTYCVSPNNSNCSSYASSCDSALLCESLSFYAANISFTSNSTFLFLPGTHTLDSHDAVFSKLSQISLISITPYESKPEVLCMETGFRFEDIVDLRIMDLDFTYCGVNVSVAKTNSLVGIFFNRVTNLNLSRVTVQNTTGYGLLMNDMCGVSVIANSTFQHCRDSEQHGGGNAVLYCQKCETKSHITIRNTSFSYGKSKKYISCVKDCLSSPGLMLYLNCSGINVSLIQVTLEGNDGYRSNFTFDGDTGGNTLGGNMAVVYKNHSFVQIVESIFSEGESFFGGGLFVHYDARYEAELLICGSRFIGNKAHVNGGGLYFEMNRERSDCVGQDCYKHFQLKIKDTEFLGNSVKTNNDAGIGLTLVYYYQKQLFYGGYGNYSTLVDGCHFEGNSDDHMKSSGSAALYTSQQFGRLVIRNSRFVNNNVTGIAAFRSLIRFKGNVTIASNSGYDGGGMVLCEASYFVVSNGTLLNISYNSAEGSGGGIFAEGRCVQTQPLCLYQIEEVNPSNLNSFLDSFLNSTTILLANNTAKFAGSQIYGGTMDRCHIPGIYWDIFKRLFQVDSTNNLTAISSDPLGVCFCDNSIPRCEERERKLSQAIYSGQPFNLSLVIVGQYNGTVPGVVELVMSSGVVNETTLQFLYANCSSHNITITTRSSNATVHFRVKNAHANYRLNSWKTVLHVRLKEAPIGFVSTGDDNHPYVCADKSKLNITQYGFKCNIVNGSKGIIRRPPPHWLGYVKDKGLVLYTFCPSSNCKHMPTDIRTDSHTFHQDDQCEYNHSGPLCGQCAGNLSMAIGSSQCLNCTHLSMGTTVGVALGLALFGIVCIFLLAVLNITVTQGTMSGFLFYANLFYIFRMSLSPPQDSHQVSWYLVHLDQVYFRFIGFMNLALGYDWCFYNGLDTVGQLWLQFLCVFYMWTITGIFVLLCRRSSWLANRVSVTSNTTIPVMATVLLLSYTSVNTAVMESIMYARLRYPGADGNYSEVRVVMLYDGSVKYLRGKHVPLFLMGSVLGILSVLFTLILVFVQPLQRYSHLHPLRWVNKLKPLLDAYTCPHIIKPHCRFWNGYLLLARVILYTLSVMRFYEDYHKMILSSIAVTCLVLVCTAWGLGGVYNKTRLNLLSSSYILNMGVLSVVALYFYPCHSDKAMIASSVSLTFVVFTFSATVAHHAWVRIRGCGPYRRLAAWFERLRGGGDNAYQAVGEREPEDSGRGSLCSAHTSWMRVKVPGALVSPCTDMSQYRPEMDGLLDSQ